MKIILCEECHKETSNPRFCCLSCSAKYNNRNSPKRKRESSLTWKERNPDKNRIIQKKYRDTHKESQQAYQLKWKYDLPDEIISLIIAKKSSV